LERAALVVRCAKSTLGAGANDAKALARLAQWSDQLSAKSDIGSRAVKRRGAADHAHSEDPSRDDIADSHPILIVDGTFRRDVRCRGNALLAEPASA